MSSERELKINITSDATGVVAAAKQTKGAFDETSGATEKLNKHHGELLKSARELQHQFPEVAGALRILAGPTGAIIFGIELFNKFKEAIDAENKALDEAIAKNADPTWREAMDAKREALEKFRDELESYRDKLDHATNSEDSYKHVIEEEINLLHERAAAQAAVTNAQNGLDTARLEQSYKLGLISAQDYYAQLSQLEINHRNQQLEAQQKADAAELALQNKKLARAYQRLGQLSVATVTDQGAEEGLVGKVAADKTDLKKAEDGRAALAKEANDAGAEIEGKWGSVDKARRIKAGGLDPMGTGVTKSLDRFDRAQQALKAADTHIDSLNRRLPGEESALGRASRAAGRDESETLALTKEIEDLKNTIGDLKDKFSAKQGGAADVPPSKETTAAKKEYEEALNSLKDQDAINKRTGWDKEYPAFAAATHAANAADVTKAWKAFKASQAADAAKQGGAADAALRENYATLLKTNPDSLTSAASVDHAAQTQQALAAHRQVSAQDKAFYEAVVQAMEERGQTALQAHNALALISGSQRTLAQKYEALVREQEQLAGQLKNHGRLGMP